VKRLAVTCLLFFCVSSTVAQESLPPDLVRFWEIFRTAVIKGAKDKVVSLTQFPVKMPGGFAEVKTAPEMIRRYDELFTHISNAPKCFADAKPVEDRDDNGPWFFASCPKGIVYITSVRLKVE
jgi:hypothetical protein